MIDLEYLQLPDGIRAILWDMDGVLIDSLQLDLQICEPLLQGHTEKKISLSRDLIASGFHLSVEDFFPYLAEKSGAALSQEQIDQIVRDYDERRGSEVFPLTPFITEVLANAKAAGLKQLVVSNNTTKIIEDTLARCGIADFFDGVVGNDIPGLKKKPAPDPYMHGAKQLGLDPAECAVVEDSLPGTAAGRGAGAFVIGVATGAAGIDDHDEAETVDLAYTCFSRPQIELLPGAVRTKSIHSPNDFVSHMVEHIAWRLGAGIKLDWPNNDWRALGRAVGSEIAKLTPLARSGASLGMIDNGSAEVLVDLDGAPGFRFTSAPSVDKELFLASRCEQISSGAPLIALGEGVAKGLGASIDVRLATFEDPHHSWEGVYRALGITLSRIYQPAPNTGFEDALAAPRRDYAQGDGGIKIAKVSAMGAELLRLTAESETRLTVRFDDTPSVEVVTDVAHSIDVSTLPELLTLLGQEAGISLDLTFRATKLSSSHVVLEDVGILLGRALLEILVQRMETAGVNGAGSSLDTPGHYADQSPQVGISVEGRKFFHIAPFAMEMNEVRRRLLFGHTVFGALRSEDLDDFLDGLCVGMSCSLMLHLRDLTTPEEDWRAIIVQLGRALRECFAPNPARKGLPPGVKATLA